MNTLALLCAVTLSVPDVDTSFKAYMDWECITNTRSVQWQLQQDAETNENGLRIYDDCYMVAMGTYYGTVGDRFTVTFDTGIEIDVIMGDVKDDRHTDKTNRYVPCNGNMLEFIVDVDELPRKARRMGDVQYADDNLWGEITEVKKIE